MHTFDMPRQSGKSSIIAKEANWCSLFGISPICIILPTMEMMHRFRVLHLENEGVTDKEDDIHLIVGARKWKREFTADIFSRIRQLKPKRIYIDEFQVLAPEFITELCKEHDDKIYAYGTYMATSKWWK